MTLRYCILLPYYEYIKQNEQECNGMTTLIVKEHPSEISLPGSTINIKRLSLDEYTYECIVFRPGQYEDLFYGVKEVREAIPTLVGKEVRWRHLMPEQYDSLLGIVEDAWWDEVNQGVRARFTIMQRTEAQKEAVRLIEEEGVDGISVGMWRMPDAEGRAAEFIIYREMSITPNPECKTCRIDTKLAPIMPAMAFEGTGSNEGNRMEQPNVQMPAPTPLVVQAPDRSEAIKEASEKVEGFLKGENDNLKTKVKELEATVSFLADENKELNTRVEHAGSSSSEAKEKSKAELDEKDKLIEERGERIKALEAEVHKMQTAPLRDKIAELTSTSDEAKEALFESLEGKSEDELKSTITMLEAAAEHAKTSVEAKKDETVKVEKKEDAEVAPPKIGSDTPTGTKSFEDMSPEDVAKSIMGEEILNI